MKSQHSHENRADALLIIVMGIIMVFTAVYVCSQNIERSLGTEMEETLMDIANQNALAVRKEIVGKYNLLLGIAEDLQKYPEREETILQGMDAFVRTYNFKRMGYIKEDGIGHTTDGYEKDFWDSKFFQKSMEGKVWVTSTLQDDLGNGEMINIFSVPVYDEEGKEIVGVAFAAYRNDNFQNIMSVDFFNAQGFSCIITEDGSVIVHSSDSPIVKETNFFDVLVDQTGEDTEAVENMREALAVHDVGFGECSGELDSENLMFCYLPLYEGEFDSQWYLVALVPKEVIRQRTLPIRDHVDKLAIVLIGIAAIAVIFYVYSDYKYKRELTRLAYDDDVTGGYNFYCFKEAAKRRKGVPGYLIAMDLADFKTINLTRGVQKGDETLQELWDILLKNIKTGEIAARVNADRFVLFLITDSRTELEQRLQKMIGDIVCLTEKLNIPKVFPIFGIYYTDRADETDKAYGCAVQAKHLVKGRRDRNFAYYDEIDSNQVIENRKMEDSFEDALKSRQFEVWYQPKYSMAEEIPIGAEALVRWRKPDGSLCSPGIFIPLFERNGNITILDEYVFRTVCAQQKKWQDAGKHIVPVSVNISRVSLYFSNIVEKYAEIIHSYDLDPKYVELEITESATIDNDNIASLIDEFHDQGFSVLLDDFGSGYSSLSSLNSMHFDTLKLDKSLIDYIGDENGEKLLKYITKLGQSLGLHITAEGVETANQLEFLKDLECDDIQGYYFSKPLPEDDYSEILRKLGIS